MIENEFTEDQLVILYNWLLEKEEAGYTVSDIINEQWNRRADDITVAN